jgi:prepilin-type N-terminal cleavage/methylation domain-containing protein
MNRQANRSFRPSRRGFTLLELGAVLAVSATISAAVMPMARKSRVSAQAQMSAGNLSVIGQGAGMYGLDNADKIPGYTRVRPLGPSRIEWELPDGSSVVLRNNVDAASWQNTELLQRITGRIDGPDHILYQPDLWHRRWSHLPLIDYLRIGFDQTLFIDPADANQLRWTTNPLDYQTGSTVPYSNGFPPGVDGSNTRWADIGSRQRWAFASSYQISASAWNPDGIDEPSYVPLELTPHLFAASYPPGSGNQQLDLSGRDFAEVAFPANKVYFFEEFDREQPGDPYFGYDHARPEKLMFDGSVNAFASGDATPSWNAANGKQVWTQRYIPLDTFPTELPGREGDLISQRYRWTLGGLSGVDYATPISSRRGLTSR